MANISAADILAFAITLRGQTLHTLYRRKDFTVEVAGKNLKYRLTNGNSRKDSRAYLARLCNQFSKSKSYTRKEYDFNQAASYTLALIAKYAEFYDLPCQFVG